MNDSELTGDDLFHLTDAYSCQYLGGSYRFDAEGEIEDCSFIGWSTSRGDDIGPSVAYFTEDGQVFLDGSAVPFLYVKTRGDLRRLLLSLGLLRKDGGEWIPT